MDRPYCWICTGKGRTLCQQHWEEAKERAARYNLSLEAATFELRQLVLDDQEEL